MATAKERVSGIELGQFIRRQRLFRGLTQEDVAKGSGKGQGQITRIESGKTATVPLTDVALYAKGLGLSEVAVLRALGHPSVADTDPLIKIRNEEALTLAEAYISYTSPHARKVLQQALQLADMVEEAFRAASLEKTGDRE